ncbi:UTRA domain-containing protein [Gluconacetobacter dulcium]|uniref:UTRA domain-containing protein n=1 Tax=Gluconacetobacter dulcium TaxID=2729096 RepID=UPI002180C069|nr:UTRA domain-containing protein [Gluconacetobacter dulcium]
MRNQIANEIEAGILSSGARLPSERKYHELIGSARGTVREALSQLEAEGLIYRKDRSGWYVSPKPVTYDPTRWSGFMTYVAEQGRLPATETLQVKTEKQPPAILDIFGKGVRNPLYRVERRRSIDERPVLVEDITINPALAPGLARHNLNGSLSGVLRDVYGLVVTRNHVEMRACALVRHTAECLGVKSGTPGLLVIRTSYDARGRVIEYDQEYWCANAIRIEVDLTVA